MFFRFFVTAYSSMVYISWVVFLHQSKRAVFFYGFQFVGPAEYCDWLVFSWGESHYLSNVFVRISH